MFVLKLRRQLSFFVSNKSSSVSVISIFVQFCDALPLPLDAFDTAMNYSCFVFSWQFRVFTAPFHKVGFADFWLADQLNSLVVILMDLEYMICFYSFEVQWEDNAGLLANTGTVMSPGNVVRMTWETLSQATSSLSVLKTVINGIGNKNNWHFL